MLYVGPGDVGLRLLTVTSGAYGEHSRNHKVKWKLRRIFQCGSAPMLVRTILLRTTAAAAYFPMQRRVAVIMTATAPPLATEGPSLRRALPREEWAL
jgi:hypothetical protein